MKVLVACEFSGIVRDAFIAKGHDAWSCDILPTERPGPHIQGDVLKIINRGWDLMIGFPPCTYLCSSGLHWNKRIPERKKKTQEAMFFVFSLLEAPIKKIALENPVGCISTHYGKPSQIIQPYMFGNNASKKTCLWLKELPLLVPTKYIEPGWVCCGEILPKGMEKHGCPYCYGEKKPLPRWDNQTNSGQNKLGPSEERAKMRSITYTGIAQAMAEQWG